MSSSPNRSKRSRTLGYPLRAKVITGPYEAMGRGVPVAILDGSQRILSVMGISSSRDNGVFLDWKCVGVCIDSDLLG